MTDTLSPAQRSWVMSRIRGQHTKPEMVLRSALHRLGFRYTLGNRHLPGSPDLVLRRYRAVVFVHGCFWHHHRDCKSAKIPKTNSEYWSAKFQRNVARDERNRLALREQGWKVVVVWECELYRDTLATVERVVAALAEKAGDGAKPYPSVASLDRRDLLKVAEQKVRYRLDKYEGNKK